MSCLGGTATEPKVWVRYHRDGRVARVEGRICKRTWARTSRDKCSGCPAFRGIRWDGVIANGLGPDDQPVGLTLDEAERYDKAMNAWLIDDEDEPLFAWYGRQERRLVLLPGGKQGVETGVGERTLRSLQDPAAQDRWAAYQRDWRAAHPGADKRKRKRDRAAYMREYRKGKK